MPAISVIVPIYKVEEYLNRCIISILAQTFSDYELILVDDGSPDNCGNICDEWVKKDERITVYHKENGGLSDARNYGIDRANGEYLTFIDSDDYIEKTYLEYLYSLFEKSPDCKVTAANHYIVRGGKKTKNKEYEGEIVLDKKAAFTEVLYHGVLDVSACCKLYKREIFETLRFPKGRLYEDTYVIGDVINSTEHIVCGSRPQYYYIQHEDSIVNTSFKEKNFEFIDSVDRLCEAALKFDSSFENACIRRKVHAKFSVLRYMEKCDKEFFQKREELKNDILKNASVVLKDKRTPKRDKIAIYSLKLGLKFFYTSWKVYGLVR